MSSRRKPSGAKERLYTFDVSFSFRMQFTFAEKEVQHVYDYLAGSEYSNKVNDVATQLLDL